MLRNSTQYVCANGRGRRAAIFILVAVTACAAAEEPMTVEQTVLLFNTAHLPAQELEKAKDVATTILEQAGIRLRWLDCPADQACDNPNDRTSLILSIQAESRQHNERHERLGEAFPAPEGGRSIRVFYNEAKLVSALHRVDVSVPVVLGHGIAHEMGHLLIPLVGHEPAGIMRGDWDPADWQGMAVGRMRFTAQEASRMRAEVKRRVSANLTARSL